VRHARGRDRSDDECRLSNPLDTVSLVEIGLDSCIRPKKYLESGRPCTGCDIGSLHVEIEGCGHRPCRGLNWHMNRTQNLLFLSFAASFLCNIRHTSQIWRKRVGVENNTGRNFKDLEEMVRNAKALKKNNKEFDGILIGPSMVPHFFGQSEILSAWVFHPLPSLPSRLLAQILRHGWQADRESTNRPRGSQ